MHREEIWVAITKRLEGSAGDDRVEGKCNGKGN